MMPRQRSGSTLLETAMFTPVLILLLVGMIELARVAYTYYAVEKIMYTLARYLGTQQGVNFCDENDPAITAAKNFALTGITDDSGQPLVGGLTADMISVRIERFDVEGEELAECECSVEGCDTANGGMAPDFIVVSIPEGYPIQLRIPALPLDPIPLKPHIRIPYGGT